ncbi:DUF779 domain-containing protein [Klugiella xanthotipulae]|uniref:DUF779 domain-containing protein n=1 Tax=Klugiella xanthotipulae TaxID=244735 RepID=A0A543HTF4_9MICO|nr:DUF779 domain-containing protein [Klugiella xanthotipulae]TQM61539.1 hypothetical protein FB466_2495 [Klugiella xanthotipulae]
MQHEDCSRVVMTRAAADVLRRVRADNGDVILHQSGGCCEGSTPLCVLAAHFVVAPADRLLGSVLDGVDADARPTPVWISFRQQEAWAHTQVVLDVVPSDGLGYSLEGDLGFAFVSRARVFTPEELAAVAPAPSRQQLEDGEAVAPVPVAPVDLSGPWVGLCSLP